MRFHLLALALVLTACGTEDDRGATAASVAPLGPDAIVLRIPLSGGAARAFRYPALDTVIWSTRVALPGQARPLGFSVDNGTLALLDSAGRPWRLTLGSGLLERALGTPLGRAVSLDGSGIFGTSAGAVLRLTTSDQTPWQVRSSAAPDQLQPLRNGGVLLIGHRDDQTILTQYRPPATAPVDSAILDGDARLISAAGGDRYYLSDGPRGLVSVRARDLEKLGTIGLGDSILTTASSPSGDRVYVLGLGDDEARIQVINKYADEIVETIDVPSDANGLRMDPLGRYLLVRFGKSADSVLVIAIATDRIIGRFASGWRSDLPLVFPDGRIATLAGNDVQLLSADEFKPGPTITAGARDSWTVVQWNGFRRRPGDTPIRATSTAADTAARRSRDSLRVRTAAESVTRRDTVGGREDTAAVRRIAKADSARGRTDSVRRPAVRIDTQPRVAADVDAPATVGERGTFVVQFAALKAERPASQMAGSIRANGAKARVMVTSSNGTVLYRVILGPFRTRADAERAGQAAGRDYWVFEGGLN